MGDDKLKRPISLINIEFCNSFNKTKECDKAVKELLKNANQKQLDKLK